jgi:hypothetical protein
VIKKSSLRNAGDVFGFSQILDHIEVVVVVDSSESESDLIHFWQQTSLFSSGSEGS